MTEQFEYRGTWFLPSNKELRLFGILTYDRTKGGELQLFGNFENEIFLHDFKNEEIIQGVTSDSEHITLVNCFMISLGEGSFRVGKEYGTPSVKYKIEFILEGVHVDRKDELKFQQLSAKIQNLDEWIGIYGFNWEKNLGNKETHVSYKSPNNIEFQINNNWNGGFFFSFDALRQRQKATVTQHVYFDMSSQSEHSLTDVLRYFYWFQHFLVLGLDRKTYWQEIFLYSDRFTTKLDDNIIPTRIKCYSYNIDYEAVKPQYSTEMLFSYQDIKKEFPSLIKNWFEKYELLEHQFNLLFANFYMDKIFSENTFLNLARAAESFHAKIHKGETKMDAGKYKEMKKYILESVDHQEYHDWLKEKFYFSNELTLHDRLSSLVDTCSNEVLNSVLGDKEIFLREVKDSRNFYTHYSEPKKHTLKDGDLYILSEKLKLLLVCAFLLEIGMEHQKLSSLLKHINTSHFAS